MNKIKKALQSVRNIKAVIVAAIITAVSTLSLALLTQNSFTLNVEANVLKPAALSTFLPEYETVSNLRKELNNRVSPAALHDLSNTYFSKNAGPAAIKDTIRMLIRHTNTYLADRKHYTYRMFRLKKIMLNMPRRNIDTRIEGAGTETFRLIQQMLQGIEYYDGPTDGDRLKNYQPGLRAVIQVPQSSLFQNEDA